MFLNLSPTQKSILYFPKCLIKFDMAQMKNHWLDILPVYGLRYRAVWLCVCVIIFIIVALLLSYQSVESWVYRNGKLSTKQQDQMIAILQTLQPLRLDGALLRWQKRFRNSQWLWQKYHNNAKPHPIKGHYKEGSQSLFYYSERQPLQVLLVGDSLAQSIELSLNPLLSNIPSVSLTANGIVSSTLTNKHFVDWPNTLRKLLSKRHYDLVLVFIGANSCQAVRNEDGSVTSYGSDNWPAAYGMKIQEFITIIKKQGAAVWWLMNPPMLKQDYQECMNTVGTAQRLQAHQMADEIIETVNIISNDDGSYIQSKVIDGKLYSLRTKDGVHFTLEGSRLISEEILRRIYQRYKIRLGRSQY